MLHLFAAGPSLPDHLQGWGTVAAVVVSLGLAIRAEVAAFNERKKNKGLLAEQAKEQRDRERRDFLVAQLLRVADLYAEYAMGQTPHTNVAIQRLRAVLHVLPDRYASLLKLKISFPMGNEAGEESERRTQEHGIGATPASIEPAWIFEEIADNLNEVLNPPEGDGQPAKGS